MHVLGIHGDPIRAKKRIAIADRKGERLGAAAYGYSRAFGYTPDVRDRRWLTENSVNGAIVVDPTAGGGSVPMEALRLGLTILANDLNPVAVLIKRATIEWPAMYGREVISIVEELGTKLSVEFRKRLKVLYPDEPENARADGYLWARTITCPYCGGIVPLSPNWRLAPDGTGVRLKPNLAAGFDTPGRVCTFEIVRSAEQQSSGTVSRGAGTCPYSDCGRVIDGGEIKAQAQSGEMGDQLYAIVYKERVVVESKSGKTREKWVRKYRVPRREDDNSIEIQALLAQKLPEWEALDIIPNEQIPDANKTAEPRRYGMLSWRQMFSPRQLLCHGTSVEIFREMLDADRTDSRLNDVRRAAFAYIALAIDTLLDYNNRASYWDTSTGRGLRHIFNRHDFAFVWSYGEMAPVVSGLGYDWAIEKSTKCIDELIGLMRQESNGANDLFDNSEVTPVPTVTITCKPGDSLDHIEDNSVDAVVMDPPYGANVMYAELSDFFYVWLKRTAGYVFPELFRRNLTDKDNEAVANLARFKGQKGAKVLAAREYQERMASIFTECRRTLKPNGIMTVMFTHKETDAWDALTKGLVEAGFVITASWPINTESEGGLHIKNKAAAKSTIFLVCRPRLSGTSQTDAEMVRDGPAHYIGGETTKYWEDIEPRVAQAVRSRILDFQKAGITGVDLYLASFGPALEEYSRHWPLKRGTPRAIPMQRRRRLQQVLFEEEWDPYAATPEDALDAARREVKRWRLEQLTHLKGDEDLDGVTAFIVLAWDAFKAPKFSYDEALRLARAVGVDIENDIVGRLAEKTGSEIVMWDSSRRATKGTLGPVDGSRGMIDAIHHAANIARIRSLAAAKELLAEALVDRDPRFFASLEAILEVLPVSRSFSGIDLKGEVAAAADDFEVLYKLSRLAYGDQIDEPEQLKLWQEENI